MASDIGDSNREKLVKGLQYVEHIAEELQLKGILSVDNVQEILHPNKTPFNWNRGLLGDIERTCASDVFAQCLCVTGQDELYQLMVSPGAVQPDTDELTTLRYRVYCQDGKGDPKKIQVPPHIQELLEEQRGELQGMKQVERLVDLMEDEGCMTAEITRAIKDQPGNEGKVNMLVDRVKESSLYSYLALTRFLDISQQQELMSKISEEDTKTALGRMDDLLLNVYYNLLGAIALKHNELEARLGVGVRDFVTLSINQNSQAVDRRGLNEAAVDQSPESGIELAELFSNTENNKPTTKVLLIGAPGAGKTTAVTELARNATAKIIHVPNIPRPPFVIQLRSVDWKKETTLKNLLLCYGPSPPAAEQDKMWRALSRSPTDITVFLVGADEVPGVFFDIKTAPVNGADIQAHPKDILNNLVSGKLLEGARVLVSSRPHGLGSCWRHFNRIVEVCGFNEESLDRFLKNELPLQHRSELLGFLESRTDIRSLLLTPLHAATFVLRAKTTEDTKELLLESRTELSLSLIDSLVKTKLRKAHGDMIPEELLKEQGDNLRKLCKLVAKLRCREGVIKTEMTSGDLKKANITVDECVATGVFSVQLRVEDGEAKSILMVPHQLILELLAAVGLEEQQILDLVAENNGRHDLVLTYVVGILGNEKNRKMLKYVFSEEGEEKDLKKLTATVVRAVLGSKRRLFHRGTEFCQRIVVDSQQWKLIAELTRVMGGRWLWPDNSEDVMLADQLIQHDPRGNTDHPLVRVQVLGIHNMRYCPRATALYHHHGEVTATDITENADHLGNMSSVSFSGPCITRKAVAELSKLNNVKAVNVEGSASLDVLGGLSSISSLQYLSLSHCRLSSDDVVAITSSCRRLLHLDISGNCGVRGGAVRSRKLTGLDVVECGMKGEELVKLAAGNGETLTYLNAIDYTNLTSTHINDILTHCPRLVELYVLYGGELVRALSERSAACRLNHLWLGKCDLSSSSSSDDQVNSSELSDVLTLHSSISSLTLYRCRITPDVMSHLSSSMAAITSLFISLTPCSSDVASLVRASPGLNQLWLDGCKWGASEYMEVIDASPALRVVGLDVQELTAFEVRVVRALTHPQTRLLLAGDYGKREDYAEVVLKGREVGVIQLTYSFLFDT